MAFCLLPLSLSDYPQDSGGFCLSLSFCILIYLLSSPISFSLCPSPVSHHFLGTLPWGSRSPVCRKLTLIICFYILETSAWLPAPEGSGGGGLRAACLHPFPPPPSFFWCPAPTPAQGGTDPAFPVLVTVAQNQALIHVPPSAAHRRSGSGGNETLLIDRCFC